MAKHPSAIGNSWSAFQGSIRESFFRNTGIPYRNLIGLLLGFTSSVLLLYGGVLTLYAASLWFVGVLIATMVILVVVRPYHEKAIDRFAWGLLVIIILGFGLGTLEYQTRSWWIWLWNQYLKIDTPPELLLEALFLLGVILGFFVVRNWAKEQAEFVSSLSAVLSGAFVATILGKLQEGGPDGIGALRAFAYYALGFTLSGTANLIVAARLTASYTNKRSISSRAILDFLYGSERTSLIDGYFLKNFKDDPDYAKRALTETLIECRKLVQREFAERLEKRRGKRKKERRAFLGSPEVKAKLADGALEEDLLSQTKPSFFYQLIAIECDDNPEGANEEVPVAEKDRKYRIIYKHIGSSSPLSHKVESSMFRVGVSARWQDKLEYITAPGEYRVPFPYQNSVAGLALEFRQTIVMDRDIHKRFRNKQYTNGICPKDIEQDRGLDEIDYLSYVSIPIVSRPGSPDENAVGVMTIDTRLFVCHSRLNGVPEKGSEGTFSLKLTRSDLSEYASNLYDPEDKDIKYIEDLTEIITPVLELYSKCRVGAI
jgi:hypothetical protein